MSSSLIPPSSQIAPVPALQRVGSQHTLKASDATTDVPPSMATSTIPTGLLLSSGLARLPPDVKAVMKRIEEIHSELDDYEGDYTVSLLEGLNPLLETFMSRLRPEERDGETGVDAFPGMRVSFGMKIGDIVNRINARTALDKNSGKVSTFEEWFTHSDKQMKIDATIRRHWTAFRESFKQAVDWIDEEVNKENIPPELIKDEAKATEDDESSED